MVDPERRLDDLEVPIDRLHTDGRKYRRWKERGGVGGWEGYERERARRGAAFDALFGEDAPPSTPEQRAAAFRAEHDTGDLSADERALMEVGVAPGLTPARFAKRFGPLVALSFALLAVFAWMGGVRHVSVTVSGVLGMAVFLGLLVFGVVTARTGPRAPAKRRTKR